MAGRFGAFAKLSRENGGGRPTDTWSCSRCSQRNSPAVERCENMACGANRRESQISGRRKANMGLDTGRVTKGGPANWAGPSRTPPVDPAKRKDPPRSRPRGRDATDALARQKYTTRQVPTKGSKENKTSGNVNGTSTSEWRSRGSEDPRTKQPPNPMERSKANGKTKAPSTDIETGDPVLIETNEEGHANQGVSKTDGTIDEDGDAANDFLFADEAPTVKGTNLTNTNQVDHVGDTMDTVIDLTDIDLTHGTEQDKVSNVWTENLIQSASCATCGLCLSDQPDVPLPILTKEDPPRLETEVGRWLGWCEKGCAVAMCGPCCQNRVTPVLRKATMKLEAVVSGLGTGYTKLYVADDPYGTLGMDPPVKCPCLRVKGGHNNVKSAKTKKKGSSCSARLLNPLFAEAEPEVHKTWAMTATEAFFAAKDSRAFQERRTSCDRSDAGEDAGEENSTTPMDVDETGTEKAAETEVLLTNTHSEDSKFAICPNFDCAARVFLEPAKLPKNGLVAERDPTSGRWLSRESLIHQHTKRYRCAKCLTDFCGDCLQTPYHFGFHLCAAAAAAKKAPTCRYCTSPHLDPGTHYFRSADTHLRGVAGDMSVKHLKKLIGKVDTDWCVTKDDLRSVFALTSAVCGSGECKEKIEQACSKTLGCGHPCGGVRGETECLPCLACPPDASDAPSTSEAFDAMVHDEDKANPEKRTSTKKSDKVPFPSGTEPCCVCYVDELKSEPCIRLGCGHVLHRRCAMARVKAGWPTQNITFEHLRCPLCGDDGREQTERGSMQAAVMSHPGLAASLAPVLALREDIMRRARRRLALDANGPPKQIKTGGEYEGRPGEYALSRFNYYLCETCETPYFGGDRACHRGGLERGDGDNQVPQQGPDAHQLVCGKCSITAKGKECKKGHGDEEMEYKCRYCCDVAVWFCFGTTHFCDKCHTRWVLSSPDWETDPPMKGCTRKTCPLRVDHPEHGIEFCLGCAVCRSLKATQEE